MKYLLFVVGALALLAAPVRAEPPEGTSIPVPRWAPEPANPPVFGPPEVLGIEPDFGETPAGPFTGPWDGTADGIVQLLTKEVEAAGGSIAESDDGSIVVTGSQAAVELARTRIAAIERHLTGRATVAVQVVALPSQRQGVVRAEDVAAVLAGAPERLLFSARFQLRRGEDGRREVLTEQGFVAEHNTEVAQDAAITELVAGSLRTGQRVYVSCRPLADDEAAITLSVGLSRAPEEILTLETATGPLDLPEVPFLSLTTGLRAKVGTSEMILVESPFDDGLIAVVVTLVGISPMPRLPFTLVDLAALVGHPDVEAAVPSLRVGLSHGADAEYGSETTARLMSMLDLDTEALGAGGVEVFQLSPTVFALAGADAARAKAVASLAPGAASGRVKRSSYRVPVAGLATTPGFDPLTGGIDVAALEGSAGAGLGPSMTLDVPVAAHTPLILVHGTWRRFIQRMGVQIAQAAAVVRPVVGTHVAGETLVLRPHPGRRWAEPQVTRTTSMLLSRRVRDLEVARDVVGERSMKRGHKLDMLRTVDSWTQFRIETTPSPSLEREGEFARIDVWSNTPR